MNTSLFNYYYFDFLLPRFFIRCFFVSVRFAIFLHLRYFSNDKNQSYYFPLRKMTKDDERIKDRVLFTILCRDHRSISSL